MSNRGVRAQFVSRWRDADPTRLTEAEAGTEAGNDQGAKADGGTGADSEATVSPTPAGCRSDHGCSKIAIGRNRKKTKLLLGLSSSSDGIKDSNGQEYPSVRRDRWVNVGQVNAQKWVRVVRMGSEM